MQVQNLAVKLIFTLLVPLVLFPASCARRQVYPSPALTKTDAVVDVSGLKQGIPKFFTYGFHGKNVNFFVIKADHKMMSFLDACTSCYPHKMGYRCDESSVTCNSCNVSFSVYQLEKGLGGCYPIKLEGRIENGKFMISRAALEAEAGKF